MNNNELLRREADQLYFLWLFFKHQIFQNYSRFHIFFNVSFAIFDILIVITYYLMTENLMFATSKDCSFISIYTFIRHKEIITNSRLNLYLIIIYINYNNWSKRSLLKRKLFSPSVVLSNYTKPFVTFSKYSQLARRVAEIKLLRTCQLVFQLRKM